MLGSLFKCNVQNSSETYAFEDLVMKSLEDGQSILKDKVLSAVRVLELRWIIHKIRLRNFSCLETAVCSSKYARDSRTQASYSHTYAHVL